MLISTVGNYDDFQLLVDGKNAFPAILKAIEEAKCKIKINMFIWRDDFIGNEIAKAVLDAANRGVMVFISVDRYGVVLEKSEESKKSFFHKKTSFLEKIKISALKLFYPMKGSSKNSNEIKSKLYLEIIKHPNIEIERDRFKADHSKYYIIDDEILFLGGINIEDKENGKDMQNRVYQDYMVRINGKQYCEDFITKLTTGVNSSNMYEFSVNSKDISPYLFEMENKYLEMINNAKSSIHITMAYFSPLPKFMDAIINAHKRGVKISILIPENANYQSDTNRKTVKKLMKESNNDIELYFSPKMLHTKLVIADDVISFGSTNITKKAFNQLSELNLTVIKDDSVFVERLLSSIKENISLSKKITSYSEIRYNRFYTLIEGMLV